MMENNAYSFAMEQIHATDGIYIANMQQVAPFHAMALLRAVDCSCIAQMEEVVKFQQMAIQYYIGLPFMRISRRVYRSLLKDRTH